MKAIKRDEHTWWIVDNAGGRVSIVAKKVADSATKALDYWMFMGMPLDHIEDESPKKDAEWRKQRPLTTGVLDYFPAALLEVAYCSFVGNEQHHAGEPLHWDKSKSTDEADALVRHLCERGTRDVDGVRHSAKVAWRALALLERELEEEGET